MSHYARGITLTAILPGSFDPVTNGHVDLIKRTLSFADRVIVAICYNIHKQGRFAPEKRASFIKEALNGLVDDRFEIRVFSGLLGAFFDECGADVVVRGVRSASEYERDLAQYLAYRRQNPKMETLFIPADPEHIFISSSMIWEIAAFGGEIREMVPDCVAAAIQQRQ